jgi:hypothetical protein
MKAESEVSISFAISIFSNEKFTPYDYRLNYKSYEELGLICENCRELVFFKQGIERVSHFSHFKDTGKGCEWKTKNNTNSSKQDTDSESREQSLQEFQTKFQKILDQGIINYQNISDIQLKNCKVQGKTLVDQYRIDINSWLSWFKEERESLRELALSLYKNNNELSEIQCRVLANIVDYLCVPASEYILEDTLYYVFFLLNKEVALNNDFEEVRSKVIEIISFADWEKEYKQATPSLTGFERANGQFVTFYEFKNESLGRHKMLDFANALSHIGTELDNENERLIEQYNSGVNVSLDKCFRSYIKLGGTSRKKIHFSYTPGECKNNKKQKIYSIIEGQSSRKLSIGWETDARGEHLIFEQNNVKVATFSLLKNQSIQWNKPSGEFDRSVKRIAIPHVPEYSPIVSNSLKEFFLEWLMSEAFIKNLTLRSRTLEYFPKLVKLLLLYLSYEAERAENLKKSKFLEIDSQVSLDEVAKTFKNLVSGMAGDTPSMKQIYKVDETFALQPVKPTE